jgi:multicomponent Na+:H+ antiporter subunit E
MVVRFIALALWAFLVWILLTWTVPAEQLVTGALIAAAVALALAPLGEVVPPWRVLEPRRLAIGLWLVIISLARIVRANVSLAVRIWRPSRPLRSGMVVVPTMLRTDAGLGMVGLITSLIVDNQITDLDRDRNVLQYHAVSVPGGDKSEQAESINAPTERILARLDRRNA